jgi:alkylation response protein AidB-like acyl-CoA dehydrogenase
MEIFKLTDAQKALIAKVDRLAEERFAPRAAKYDAGADVPVEDLQDLHKEGLLLACADKKWGGLGYGVHQDDPLCFFLTIERIARVNPGTAHDFQVHNNCVQMICYGARDEQIPQFLEPTRVRGKMIPGAGSEPAMTSYSAQGGLSSTAKKVDGGYLVNGIKHYATNASYAEWLWVGLLLEGTRSDITLMIPADAEGVSIDASVWDPIGMRACVSPLIKLENVFVPEEYALGRPGMLMQENWLGKINLGFTATYLGAMQGIFDYLVPYVREKGRGKDPFRQVQFGEMKTRIDAVRLLMYTAISNFQSDPDGAMLMANEAKWMAVESVQRFMYLVGQAGGPTVLFKNRPVERLIRDLHLHVLHGRQHMMAMCVGQAALGEPYNLNLSV